MIYDPRSASVTNHLYREDVVHFRVRDREREESIVISKIGLTSVTLVRVEHFLPHISPKILLLVENAHRAHLIL